jgi:RNA polymerase sigma-70 factor (ECF subfamily)
MQNDIVTIDALKKGASYAQEELVRCYMERVRNLIFAIVQNMQDAEELTQDTFLAVFKNVCRYDVTGTTLASLVYRIAYNKALSFLKRHRLQLVPLNEDTIESAWSVYSTGEDYAEDDEGKIQELEKMMNALSPQEKAIITLYYYEERKVDDIAYIMEVTPKAIYKRLERIRNKLRVRLKESHV